MSLLDAQALYRSPVVTDCSTNSDRPLARRNGYRTQLNLDILALLHERSGTGEVAWVDLCCGSGRACIDAADALSQSDAWGHIRIEGVDLAGNFRPNPYPQMLRLLQQPIEAWEPNGPYELVTCVHGLHYLGDKLAALAMAAANLSPNGLLIANIDVNDFRYAEGHSAGMLVIRRLHENGFIYDEKRRLIRCEGPRNADFRFEYLGADDTGGPNYTGHRSIRSFYSRRIDA